MTLAAAGALLTEAAAQRRVVAAFPVLTLDQAQAVVQGAETARSPVIVQLGPDAVRHHAGRLLPLARAVAELAEPAGVPVALHLDRVRSTALLAQAAHARCSSVLYDAGRLPRAREVATTAEVVRWAHEQGLWAEGEWARPGRGDAEDESGPGRSYAEGESRPGRADAADDRAAANADVAAVRDYVALTGVDSLAVPDDPALLARLRSALRLPLVLHAPHGLPEAWLVRAAAAGATKVVLGSVLDAALTRTLSAQLARDAHADPRTYLAAGQRAMAAAVARLITTLNAHAARPTPPSSKEHLCQLLDEERSARPSRSPRHSA
ncbi:fructose-bisphosphate aldolase [Streptomyces sp. Ru71]|uniref:class II fructose-bisphosphate aldolase n=1 Tax=Streptomyces sp. Ru71 TaxID=2080746 RepID=UPI000CDE0CEB|nr:class II fructose-bisphosphate aldolase [Streptomyces sp. Ru71]POX48262.1 fructose-bisphosphate aldolase [Streptomyces sp. Ru71]